jgi:hypothetical protein
MLDATKLQVVWRSVVDDDYAENLLKRDEGWATVEQAAEQFARVSLAAERNFEACYVLPWSGQLRAPAAGASQSEVTLTIQRTKRLDLALVVEQGFVVRHDQTDSGPVDDAGWRRYLLADRLVMMPGDGTNHSVLARAENPGKAYDEPAPGTITLLDQPVSRVSGTGATCSVVSGQNLITFAEGAETLSPLHAGLYVELMSGANQGEVRRITMPVSSTAMMLDRECMLVGQVAAGTVIAAGDTLEQGSAIARVVGSSLGGGTGTVQLVLLVDEVVGTFTAGAATVAGVAMTVTAVTRDPLLTDDSSTAWRLLSFGEDLGLTATNAASPSGGSSATLDEIGAERRVFRSPGEGDETYRWRVAEVADTVCPNAVRRRANELLAPFNATVVYRQVGSPLLPGFFCDVPDDSGQHYCCDDDEDDACWKVSFDDADSRAFFFLQVPLIVIGTYGIACDADEVMFDGPCATDEGSSDGETLLDEDTYQTIQNEIERIVAGGVGFDLVIAP